MVNATERCPWAQKHPEFAPYHDKEWGKPEYDDRALYEKLMLDGFQAGLSWITILKKRDNFRQAFDGFEPQKIASYDATDIERLLQNKGIVRHRGKIESTIKAARLWLEIMEKGGGFSAFLWKYVDGTPLVNHWQTQEQVPAQTMMSQALSKELKQLGFNFCGPVIVYAFAQAVGMVNDHLVSCPQHTKYQ